MMLRRAFWTFAHKRYQFRKPRRSWEIVAVLWASLLLVSHAVALIVEFERNWGSIPIWIVLDGLPVAFAILHRKIRLERLKGPDALYRKVLAARS